MTESIRMIAINCVSMCKAFNDNNDYKTKLRGEALINLAIKESGYKKDLVCSEMNKILEEIK